MKTTTRTLITAAALLSMATGVYAQAPAGTTSRPAQEADANKSGGPAAAKAEMNTDSKKSTTSTSASGGSMKAMDTNGDGMVSKAEWDAYHVGMWGKMKLKNGMASTADVQAAMKAGGPN